MDVCCWESFKMHLEELEKKCDDGKDVGTLFLCVP